MQCSQHVLWRQASRHTSIADITPAVRNLPGKAAADRRFTLVVKADAILSVEEEEEVRVRAGQRVL